MLVLAGEGFNFIALHRFTIRPLRGPREADPHPVAKFECFSSYAVWVRACANHGVVYFEQSCRPAELFELAIGDDPVIERRVY
ncbi:hypothetical protein BHQ18_06645 [Mycolicibacterium flavescens]|uniref:Uncharacterized protein n=1 Tax=Mycolicibacterium flavescens TaxID=1776 RepID=A0A1E3RNV1_MYCFV|nr:hypothetical protein BHQ18_06645 [Mycolicibacterium flavescens]